MLFTNINFIMNSSELLKRAVELANIKAGTYPPGTQIMYMPNHANPFDDNCEYGFIMRNIISDNDEYVFCRFFHKASGYVKGEHARLRTTANSEACRPEDLYIHTSRDQKMVDDMVKDIQQEV